MHIWPRLTVHKLTSKGRNKHISFTAEGGERGLRNLRHKHFRRRRSNTIFSVTHWHSHTDDSFEIRSKERWIRSVQPVCVFVCLHGRCLSVILIAIDQSDIIEQRYWQLPLCLVPSSTSSFHYAGFVVLSCSTSYLARLIMSRICANKFMPACPCDDYFTLERAV